MSIKLHLPSRFYYLWEGKEVIDVTGKTVAECLDELVRLILLMKLPAACCGVSWAEFRRSLTRLRSHELRRGRLAILSGRSLWRRLILSAASCRVSWRRRMKKALTYEPRALDPHIKVLLNQKEVGSEGLARKVRDGDEIHFVLGTA